MVNDFGRIIITCDIQPIHKFADPIIQICLEVPSLEVVPPHVWCEFIRKSGEIKVFCVTFSIVSVVPRHDWGKKGIPSRTWSKNTVPQSKVPLIQDVGTGSSNAEGKGVTGAGTDKGKGLLGAGSDKGIASNDISVPKGVTGTSNNPSQTGISGGREKVSSSSLSEHTSGTAQNAWDSTPAKNADDWPAWETVKSKSGKKRGASEVGLGEKGGNTFTSENKFQQLENLDSWELGGNQGSEHLKVSGTGTKGAGSDTGTITGTGTGPGTHKGLQGTGSSTGVHADGCPKVSFEEGQFEDSGKQLVLHSGLEDEEMDEDLLGPEGPVGQYMGFNGDSSMGSDGGV